MTVYRDKSGQSNTLYIRSRSLDNNFKCGQNSYMFEQAYGTVAIDGVDGKVPQTLDFFIKLKQGQTFTFEIDASSDSGARTWISDLAVASCRNTGKPFTEAEAKAYERYYGKLSVSINTTDAGWGTLMLPFAATLPNDVKAYSCNAVDGATLTLTEVDALAANMPYIIEGTWNATLTDEAQSTATTHTVGLLTGTYVDYQTTGGEYVLQKQNNQVGFYQVGSEASDAKPFVRAYHAYLTAPDNSVKAFILGGGADAIKDIFDNVAAGEVYDLGGRKVGQLQRGVNIVNGKKVILK